MPGTRGRRGYHTAAQRDLGAADIDVVERYKAGETLAAIAIYVDLTRERGRQIVKASGATIPWEFECGVDICSTSSGTPKRYRQANPRASSITGIRLGLARLMDQHGTLACYKRGRCRRIHLWETRLGVC